MPIDFPEAQDIEFPDPAAEEAETLVNEFPPGFVLSGRSPFEEETAEEPTDNNSVFILRNGDGIRATQVVFNGENLRITEPSLERERQRQENYELIRNLSNAQNTGAQSGANFAEAMRNARQTNDEAEAARAARIAQDVRQREAQLERSAARLSQEIDQRFIDNVSHILNQNTTNSLPAIPEAMADTALRRIRSLLVSYLNNVHGVDSYRIVNSRSNASDGSVEITIQRQDQFPNEVVYLYWIRYNGDIVARTLASNDILRYHQVHNLLDQQQITSNGEIHVSASSINNIIPTQVNVEAFNEALAEQEEENFVNKIEGTLPILRDKLSALSGTLRHITSEFNSELQKIQDEANRLDEILARRQREIKKEPEPVKEEGRNITMTL